MNSARVLLYIQCKHGLHVIIIIIIIVVSYIRVHDRDRAGKTNGKTENNNNCYYTKYNEDIFPWNSVVRGGHVVIRTKTIDKIV